MVPLGGRKTVRLVGGDALAVTSSNPRIATVTTALARGVRSVTIQGVRRGSCQIIAGSGATRAVLDVDVKRRITVRTAFHYVDDGHVQKTTRRIADLNALITAVNGVMLPQANVQMTRHSAAALRMRQNLRRVVRFSSHLPGVRARQHEWDDVTANADATADFNVFFVVEYEQDATPLHDDAQAGTLRGSCIMEDNVGQPDGETLAHEMSHHLGAADKNAPAGDLMTPAGRKLRKAEINTMNP
jgi:hypothetical protein